MKNICIVAGTLNDYHILKPLMQEIQKDESVYLTVISTGKHQSSDLEITYRRVEEEGFTIDEKTSIVFNTQKFSGQVLPDNFEHLEYDRILSRLNPDIVILLGNSYETFAAAIAASLNNIPIAHIQGGESDFRTWDDSFGFGITKLSHLHFTQTAKYRQQVIRFGEHAERVFNVGSLLVERIKARPLEEKSFFYNKTGFNIADQFLFISFHPDASMGSKNGPIFHQVLKSLTHDRLKNFKLVFNKPKETGLGKLLTQMIDKFTIIQPHRTISFPFMELPDLSCAIKYCSVLIGNSAQAMSIAPCFKTPVINIGTRQQDKTKSANIIDCPPQNEDILTAVQNGLSTHFKGSLKNMSSPFEKPSTARKIKDIIKTFRRSDICKKEFFKVLE
ncbi:MAG: UDP-N-acetylglucosamine 2-epimerase (hydrolyzing) [Proteobacteria bacterium]|nr:UDP-N-acetylglucosamine 2-epimerase (hydrolyzing) [Pseudomonadota bacterium]MBU1581363.1 UDP-N-acetylglucosamine 2-epimerase (hydrolyzing) [Pseudomonadota bacterium]MBU2451708.1 UDP-N-acetylglucosamine 2-epimerase (hydrolyzing) [Pseudomonadota bacterium]MBU2627727.1 UDP-N-acetylglucosamine 2-epimerase (hydrolyzing) [Pseudomonadota bacterium]